MLLPLFALALTGCSQKMDAFQKTAKMAIWGLDDVQVSAERAAQTPYASAYLRIGNVTSSFRGVGPLLKTISLNGLVRTVIFW
ncbi:MAG: hypothetical protein ACSLEN_11230 [Candidatus Malihini olakiniferum]